MVCVKCGVYTSRRHSFQGGGCLCKNCYTVKVQSVLGTAKANGIEPEGPKMRRGEIVEIQPSGHYARQWLVQGSAREPYKVSLTKNAFWQCGCPAGKTSPSGDHCKHVLQVQLKFGYGHPADQTLIGVISGDKVMTASGKILSLSEPEVEATGRRFRD